MNNNAKALKRIISRFENEWQGEAELVIKRLYELMDKGMKVEPAIRTLQKEFPKLFGLEGIRSALTEAAAYGYGIMPSVLADAEKLAIASVVEKPWSADGMKLSQKLHAYSDKLYQTIVTTVQEQVKKNATAIQISRQLYDGYNSGVDRLQRGRFTEDQRLPKYINQIKRLHNATLEDSAELRRAAANIERLARNGAPNRALKAGYSKLLEAVKSDNDKAIKEAINVAVNEKSRYIAERIARTEMARAYADGFFSKHNNDKDVAGYLFELSTRHPVFDVCDMYANADMFNLGKGVYPKDKLPLIPIHPHCLCTYSVLYKGQIDLSKRKNQQHQAIAKWINGLDEKHAVQVMGRTGYNAFKASKLAYNGSKVRTSTNIPNNTNKYAYERFIRNYDGLGSPQYREINLYFHSLPKDGQNAIIKEIIGKDFADLTDYIGKLDSYVVRKWYIDQDKNHIYDKIDESLPLLEKAKKACAIRIEHRNQARALMADRKEAERLEKDKPNKSFEELLEHKMKDKGLTYEEALKDIYKTASKTNEKVNVKLGLGDLL